MTSISVVIPSLNEEKNIAKAIKKAITIGKMFRDYEIICVDGGSTDNTIRIIQKARRINGKIHILSDENGVGSCYRKALIFANNEYFMLIAGDNEDNLFSLQELAALAGEDDLIIGYPLKDRREWHRKLLSSTFRTGMNTLFGLKLKYYTGNFIAKTSDLKQISFPNSFLYAPTIITKLIKLNGCTYLEVPQKKDQGGSTKIFRWQNVVACFVDTCRLVLEVYVTNS